MGLPTINYVVNEKGEKVFVQISLQEWETFLKNYQRLAELALVKESLTNALREIRQVQKGQLKPVTIEEFLYELQNYSAAQLPSRSQKTTKKISLTAKGTG